MGFFKDAKSFVSKFSIYTKAHRDTEISASSQNTKVNPIVKAMQDLNGRWRIQTMPTGDYVRFGANDDIPEILEKLKLQSPTHSGIITKKSKMVAGNELTYDDSTVHDEERNRWRAFWKNAGGDNISLRSVFIDAAYRYEHHGGVAYLITRSGRRIVKVEVLGANSFRCGVPDMNNNIPYYVVRRTFNKRALRDINNKPRKVKPFTMNGTNRESILYVKNPRSSNDIYGVPDYLSAYYFITSDFEFGKHIENSSANGFSPKVLATFIGRNMTDEQKDEESNNFKENFTGSDGEQVMISWVKKMEDAPEFEVLDIKNLDRTIDVLARLNDSKILTAHNVTSPTLFGIMVAGKLGGTGDELQSAYNIFRTTETLPNRQMHMENMSVILERAGYGEVVLDIIDIDVDTDAQENKEEDD